MKFYNLKHPEQEVSFSQAVRQGLGKNQGLFFPEEIPNFADSIDQLLAAVEKFFIHVLKMISRKLSLLKLSPMLLIFRPCYNQ
jgi:threonine synthase